MLKQSILLCAILILVSAVIGGSFAILQTRQIEDEQFRNLESISKLKAEQIENWLRERQGDCKNLSVSHGLIAAINELVDHPNHPETSKYLSERFGMMIAASGYSGILLLDGKGRLLAQSGGAPSLPYPVMDLFSQALADGQIRQTDLYRNPANQVRMDWIVPIAADAAKGNEPRAGIVLSIDPNTFLYPMIGVWPTASDSAETLLARREGDFAVYLNELRYLKDAALTLKLPLSTRALPAAAAVQTEQPGVLRGYDYRDVEVLAAYRPVAGTNWRIIARIDRAETLAPMWRSLLWIVAIAILAAMAVFFAARKVFLNRQRVRELELQAEKSRIHRQIQTLGDNLPNGFVYQYTLTADGRKTFNYISAGVEKLFGLPPECLLLDASLLFNCIAPESQADFARNETASMRDLGIFSCQLLFNPPGKPPLWLRLQSQPRLQADGGMVWDGVGIDVTAQHLAASRIAESKERFRKLFNVIPDPIFITSLDGKFVNVNRAACEFLGYNREELLALGPADIDTPEFAGKVPERIEELLEKRNQVFESAHIKKNGEIAPVEISQLLITLGRSPVIIGVARDLTERKSAEQALEKTRQMLEEAQHIAHLGSWDWNIAGQSVTWSDEAANIYVPDNPAAEPSFEAFQTSVHPEDYAYVMSAIEAALNHGAPYDIEHRVLSASRRERQVHALGKVFRDPGGKPVRMVGTVRDITEQKQAEAALRFSEQRFRIVSSIASDLIFSCHRQDDGFFRVEWIGGDPKPLLGFDADELIAAGCIRPLLLRDDLPLFDANITALQPDQSSECILRIFHKSMEPRYIRLVGHVIADSAQQGRHLLFGALQDLTALKLTETALRKNEQHLRAILETTSEAVTLVSKDGVILSINSAGLAMLEAGAPESVLDKSILPLIAPEHRDAFREFNRKVCGGEPGRLEYEIVGLNGRRGWMEAHAVPFAFEDSNDIVQLAFSREITERKQTELKLKLAASVFTHAREGILITDENANIVDCNDTFSLITGYAREEVLGKNPRLLQDDGKSRDFYDEMWASLSEKGHWSGELWNRRKNGELFAEMLTISAVLDGSGNVQNYVGLFSDITALKQHQQQLERIAHYDPLTGLPNRVLLADRLQQAIAQNRRRDRSMAVAYIDLDGFKEVNDKHGHNVGDELLIGVAQRMKDVLREGDTLSRIGGDEFIAVLCDLENAQDYNSILDRLLAAAASPVHSGGLLLQVSASIGVTLYPEDGTEADQLMRHADQAMYRCKRLGKNRYCFFDPRMDALEAARPD